MLSAQHGHVANTSISCAPRSWSLSLITSRCLGSGKLRLATADISKPILSAKTKVTSLLCNPSTTCLHRGTDKLKQSQERPSTSLQQETHCSRTLLSHLCIINVTPVQRLRIASFDVGGRPVETQRRVQGILCSTLEKRAFCMYPASRVEKLGSKFGNSLTAT